MIDRTIKKIALLLVISCLSSSVCTADFDWDDSEEFSLDLVTVFSSFTWADSQEFSLDLVSENRSFAWGTSSSFSISLLGTNRVWADSDEFPFDCFEGTAPVIGDLTPQTCSLPNWLLKELSPGGEWQAFTQAPAAGTPVFILNHGWNDGPWGDPEHDDDDLYDLAKKIRNNLQTSNAAIYCWHWGDGKNTVSDANPNGEPGPMDFAAILNYVGSPFNILKNIVLGDEYFHEELNKAYNNAKKHGNYLGNVLDAYGITPDNYNIHMIGHSFGGVVCAEAAKIINAASSGVKVKQLTTLETPGLPWPNAVKYVTPDLAERVEVVYYHWLTDIGGIGFGGPAGSGGNLLNLHTMPIHYGPTLHSRILEWYIDSMSMTTACTPDYYGFNWSFARNDLNPNWPNGLDTGRKAELLSSVGCMQPWAGERAVEGAVKAATKQVDDFVSAVQWTGQSAQIVGEWVGGVFTSSLSITTSSVMLMSAASEGSGPISTLGEEDPATTAGVFKDMVIPADADTLEVDLRFTSVVDGHFFVITINDDQVLYLDANAEGVSDVFETYSAYIGNYAGQTVTVQIAIEGADEQQTNVLIDSLRFSEITIAADINEDTSVGLADLMIMSEYWAGPVYAPGDDSDKADLNGDGKINFADFSLLAESWGWSKQ